MTKSFFLSFFLLLSLVTFSQQGDGGFPKTFKEVIDYNKIDKRVFDEPNIAALKIEDSLTDNSGTAPWRFGFNNQTNLNISNAGTWTNLSNGDRIWQLVVVCKNALTVNLTFSQTTIPKGNELYVYNPSKDFILGKFTAYHLYNGELGTELVPGEITIVEYFVPKESSIGNVNICTVTHGYRTPNEFLLKAFGGSGACNVNVNCPVGAAWTLQRNSVVMLVSGSNGFCTGALINNTLNDGKPYVLTANHCYSNPATWIFRFKWESTSCTNPSTSPIFLYELFLKNSNSSLMGKKDSISQYTMKSPTLCSTFLATTTCHPSTMANSMLSAPSMDFKSDIFLMVASFLSILFFLPN